MSSMDCNDIVKVCRFLHRIISSPRKKDASRMHGIDAGRIFARNCIRAREEERTRGGKYSNWPRSFNIKAPRVIDWCSGGYTPASRTTTVASTSLRVGVIKSRTNPARKKQPRLKKEPNARRRRSFCRVSRTFLSRERVFVQRRRRGRTPDFPPKRRAGRYDDAFV